MSLPLDGLRVWITRPEPALSPSVIAWRRHGATVVGAPTVEVRACDPLAHETEALIAALERHAEALVVLPSPRAADHFARAFGAMDAQGRVWRVAVLGEATARRARAAGLEPILTASRALGAVLAREIVAACAPALVLLPSSDRRRPELGAALRSAGVEVVDLTVHRTLPVASLPAAARQALTTTGLDLLTAYSPSALGFCQSLDATGTALLREVAVAALGPTTAAAARDLGLRVAIEPDDPSEEALLAATAAWWAAR